MRLLGSEVNRTGVFVDETTIQYTHRSPNGISKFVFFLFFDFTCICFQGFRLVDCGYQIKEDYYRNYLDAVKYWVSFGKASCCAFVLLYAMDDNESLYFLEPFINRIRALPNKPPIVLVGNKKDLANNNSMMLFDVKAWAYRRGVDKVFQVSATSGENLARVSQYIAKRILRKTCPETEDCPIL